MIIFSLTCLTCLNLFTLTKNQKCSWERGVECCTGYSLNKHTGECEKCPKGYFGDCSKQCIPPTYGEDCQSLCSCADGYYCHFAYGCSQLDRSKTELQHTSSALRINETSTEPTIALRNIPVDDRTSTLSNLCEDDAVYKNNGVFIATISLIGISVLFSVAYVLTSCFLKNLNSNAQKKTNDNIDRNILV